MNGFNPMRWNCKQSGCFNVKCRPKIEIFADCFPRRINFGDVDGLVEISGKFCLLEWKRLGVSIRYGQRESFRQFTLIPGNIVFIVYGDAETMNVECYRFFWQGELSDVEQADLNGLKEDMKYWADTTRRYVRK
jgi:hypothetical protein